MILKNAIKTPDGTILESKFRHDYVSYKDENGERYTVDGGREYLRRSLNIIKPEDLSVTSESSTEMIRDNVERYNTRSDSYVKIRDISDDWLDAIIEWYDQIVQTSVEALTVDFAKTLKSVYEREKVYRTK